MEVVKNAEGWCALTRTDARGGRCCSAAVAHRKPTTEVDLVHAGLVVRSEVQISDSKVDIIKEWEEIGCERLSCCKLKQLCWTHCSCPGCLQMWPRGLGSVSPADGWLENVFFPVSKSERGNFVFESQDTSCSSLSACTVSQTDLLSSYKLQITQANVITHSLCY